MIVLKQAFQRQSIYDFVIQHYGTVEAYTSFCRLNEIDVDDDLTVGQEYKVETEERVAAISSFFELNKITVSTREEFEEIITGIGSMKIGSTFIVS